MNQYVLYTAPDPVLSTITPETYPSLRIVPVNTGERPSFGHLMLNWTRSALTLLKRASPPRTRSPLRQTAPDARQYPFWGYRSSSSHPSLRLTYMYCPV